jgi:hypothetical protein
MRSFKVFIFFLLLAAMVVPGQAQIKRNFFKTMEVYVGGGPTLYFGEVGGKDSKVTGAQSIFDNLDIDLWQMKGALTTGIRYSLFKQFAASLELTPMLISGSDLRSNKAWSRPDTTNYSFSTFLTELSARAEIYFSDRINSYAPYLIIGAGGMAYGGNGEWGKNSTSYGPSLCTSYIFGFGQRFPQKKKTRAHTLELSYHFTGGKTADNLDGFNAIKKGGNNDLLFLVTYKYSIELASRAR